MDATGEKVGVVVRPGKRTRTVLVWLRQLLPAAVLLVSPAGAPAPDAPDGAAGDASDAAPIVIEADAVESPMSLAAALARGHGALSPPDR